MSNFSLCLPLERKGSRLISAKKTWQMLRISKVEENLDLYPAELWEVETSCGERLILFRSKNDFGMRFPQLLRVESNHLALAL
jgi:hypothetical protein